MIFPAPSEYRLTRDASQPNYTEVFHICHTEVHPLCGKIGSLATVTTFPPELPEGNLADVFIMQFNAREADLTTTEETGVYQARLAMLASRPHSVAAFKCR